MNEKAGIDAVLNYLLNKYLENPTATWDLAGAMADAGIGEIQAMGSHLLKKGYIKHPGFSDDGFTCTITTLGIHQVSDIFSDVKYKILEASIERKKTSVMEILGIEAGHFKRVHDYATHLKRLGIIECIFHTDDVFASPTFFGKEWYAENKLKFISA